MDLGGHGEGLEPHIHTLTHLPMCTSHAALPGLLMVLLLACGQGGDTHTDGTATGGTVPMVPVTTANFTRAETDAYMAGLLKKQGIGVMDHQRELIPINDQTVVRSNRDTYYSIGVFDLDAGPVTITLPDAGDRYMSLLSLDEDHYVAGMDHAPMTRTFMRDAVGTRYMVFIVRTFGDPNDTNDVAQVHALQDAITAAQPGGHGGRTHGPPGQGRAARNRLTPACLRPPAPPSQSPGRVLPCRDRRGPRRRSPPCE